MAPLFFSCTIQPRQTLFLGTNVTLFYRFSIRHSLINTSLPRGEITLERSIGGKHRLHRIPAILIPTTSFSYYLDRMILQRKKNSSNDWFTPKITTILTIYLQTFLRYPNRVHQVRFTESNDLKKNLRRFLSN